MMLALVFTLGVVTGFVVAVLLEYCSRQRRLRDVQRPLSSRERRIGDRR